MKTSNSTEELQKAMDVGANHTAIFVMVIGIILGTVAIYRVTGDAITTFLFSASILLVILSLSALITNNAKREG